MDKIVFGKYHSRDRLILRELQLGNDYVLKKYSCLPKGMKLSDILPTEHQENACFLKIQTTVLLNRAAF